MRSDQAERTTTGTTVLTVRYFAAARAASGTDEEPVELAAGSTVDDVLGALARRHGSELDRVLARCSFLLDEVTVRDRTVRPAAGAILDVLPPFAGG